MKRLRFREKMGLFLGVVIVAVGSCLYTDKEFPAILIILVVALIVGVIFYVNYGRKKV